MIFKIIALVVILIVLMAYSLCAVASEADEQLERWEYERSNNKADE